MNILVPDSWLREYLKTKATAPEIARALSLHSASVEKISRSGDELVYEIEITGNRIDMVSIAGLAREAAVALRQNKIAADFQPLKVVRPKLPKNGLPFTIKNNPQLCRRIVAVVIDGLKIGLVPDFIKKRLEAAGLRSLNNLVDITNYVMLEVGHPCHAFDYDRLPNRQFIIREAKKGETIVSFDGKAYQLEGGDIVFDDGNGQIVDLPGIIGTKNSVVTTATKRVLFFIENNRQDLIRKSSMSLGIRTMAAAINEKGPDPELAMTALLRGVELYQQQAGGRVASEIFDVYERPFKKQTVSLEKSLLDTYLGIDLSADKVRAILDGLELPTKYDQKKAVFTTEIPAFRENDLKIAQDLIEEVARIYGYHNLPERVRIGNPVKAANNDFYWIDRVKTALKFWGFAEVYTSSLVAGQTLENYGLESRKAVKLKNPLGQEGEYLRPSLVPSIIESMQFNLDHGETDFQLFEIAKTYFKDMSEVLMLTGALTGSDLGKDLLQVKAYLEGLLWEMGLRQYRINPQVDEKCPIIKLLKPDLRAQIEVDGQAIGVFGAYQNLVVFDLDFQTLLKKANRRQVYQKIPQFPAIIEDFSFQLPPKTAIQPVIEKILTVDKLVTEVKLVDSYENTRTLRVFYQHPDRNLSDKDIQDVRKKIFKTVDTAFTAKVR